MNFSFLREDGHLLHVSQILKKIGWLSPSALFVENGWPPPRRIVLQCIILHYTVSSGVTCIILYYAILYNIVLYYIILYYPVLYYPIL